MLLIALEGGCCELPEREVEVLTKIRALAGKKNDINDCKLELMANCNTLCMNLTIIMSFPGIPQMSTRSSGSQVSSFIATIDPMQICLICVTMQ